jgi:hypothetical protein
MLITILGGIIVLLVAGFISWPLLGASDSSRAASPEDFQTQEDFLVLEKRRDNALSSLRDAEMDHETGRLSEADYASMRSELESEAMAAIAELDQMGGSGPGAAGFCPACGAARAGNDAFCGQCGTSLPPIVG